MWKITKKLLIIIVIAGVFLTVGEAKVFADTCKDLSLSYASSSFCTSSKKQASSSQTTILRLFDMKPIFNEGDPVVFVGDLTKGGNAVKDAKITIKHDGTCKNKTIGYGITDKTGRFWILANAKIWDKKDNLVNTHAEFSGRGGLQASISESKIVVVYPVKNKLC